jgi:hypothetical protein
MWIVDPPSDEVVNRKTRLRFESFSQKLKNDKIKSPLHCSNRLEVSISKGLKPWALRPCYDGELY